MLDIEAKRKHGRKDSRKVCDLNSSRLGLSTAGPENLYRREIGPVETADTEE
jgi:hypothetical protein